MGDCLKFLKTMEEIGECEAHVGGGYFEVSFEVSNGKAVIEVIEKIAKYLDVSTEYVTVCIDDELINIFGEC